MEQEHTRQQPAAIIELKVILLRPQGQIIDVKCKNRKKSAIWNFFQPLSNSSENWLVLTFLTHLSRINEKLLMLSRPQGRIIDVKCKKSQ